MKNIFYMNGAIWLSILLLYFFGWSDLCTKLTPSILFFLLFYIVLSFIVGYLSRKKMDVDISDKYDEKKFNKKNQIIITTLLVLYILSFLISGFIPLLNVITGVSYNAKQFIGIPHFNIIISSFSIFYAFYLSIVFSIYKNKKALISILIILLFFILCYARQNIIIILIIFFYNLYLSTQKNNLNVKHVDKLNIKKYILIIFVIAIGLYIFGIMGNSRYGKWKWNDSSMILSVGQVNNNYPSLLPKEYFWTYVYLTSPLSNLNYNVSYYKPLYSSKYLIREILPEFLFDKNSTLEVYLPVKSLNASTGFARPYLSYGYLGIYTVLLIELTIVSILIHMASKIDKIHVLLTINVCMYLLLFMFFTNTLTYSITSMLIFYNLIYNLKIKRRII